METPTVLIENATPEEVVLIESRLTEIRSRLPEWYFPVMAGPAWNRWTVRKEEVLFDNQLFLYGWSIKRDRWQYPEYTGTIDDMIGLLEFYQINEAGIP